MNNVHYLINNCETRKKILEIIHSYNLSECYVQKNEKIYKNSFFLVWIQKKFIIVVFLKQNDVDTNCIMDMI